MTEEELFEAARHIRAAEDRAAYLDGVCAADPALRQRVEALLRSHSEAGDFPDHPVVEGGTIDEVVPADVPSLAEGPGSRIGPYKLLQQLGEGGMGAVFMAEQEEPVKRRVALKIIKAGMDSARVIGRFEAERQALAMMDHPNIAKVLDAGATDSGRPYFVMELVKGIPITKFCDQEHLTPKERLELFIPVCQAVQHAHQKGIIHRDLKPSNVLIALYDGKAVPKVIDFGVAKATAQKLTERTMFTEIGQIVGTLEYMAPEQAELNNLDIDTRADIYSLGVLLYELLTGSPPFTAQQLRSAAFTEMLRMIREVEPPRPSTKLSSSQELPAIAAKRKLEPAKLAKLIRGDLDWIVMKCLEKERGRRYETANGLAMDVQRFLADEAVLASPPSVRYRLMKFVRKHRGPVLAASLIAVLLVGGIVGTSLGFVRAERLRQSAEDNEQVALKEKAKALASAESERQAKQNETTQRQKAEASQRQAMEALRATTDDVVEQLIGAKQALGPAEKTFLVNTLKRWQTFAAEQGHGELARAVRAEGVFRVAFLRAKLGEQDAAQVGFRDAAILWEDLARQFPAVPRYRQNLAGSNNNLSNLLHQRGKHSEAEVACRKALTIRNQLAAEFPNVPEYRHVLAGSHINLGNLLVDLGNRTEAEAAYRQGLAILDKLASDFPTVAEYRQDLATGHHNLANLLMDLGRRTEAEAAFRQALSIQDQLAGEFPIVAQYRQGLANSYNSLGLLLAELGKHEAAEEACRKGLTIQGKLAIDFPAVPEYREGLADRHTSLGLLLVELGKRTEAEAAYRQALTIQEKLAADFPNMPDYRGQLVASHNNLGILLVGLGKRGEAEAAFRHALTIGNKLAADFSTIPQYRQELAASHNNLGGVLVEDMGKRAEAEAAYRQALTIQEKLAAEFPAVPAYRQQLARSHKNLGILFVDTHKRAEAEVAYRQALTIRDKLAAEFPGVPQYRIDLGGSQLSLGHFLRENKQPEQALEWYGKAIATLEIALRQVKVDATGRLFLRDAHWGRAGVLDELKHYTAAAADWAKAVELSPESNRLEIHMQRMQNRVRAGQVDPAIREAGELPKNTDAGTLYQAACVFALAADRRDETAGSLSKEECARRAMSLLQQAVAKGWNNAEHMKKDDDLKALRDRDDFKKLLAELEKKFP